MRVLLSNRPGIIWGAVLAVGFVLFGCGGNGGGGGGHIGTTTTTTTTTGTPGITSLSIEFPADVVDSGAAVGNNGGMEYYGGSGIYRSPSGTITNLTSLDGTTNNAHAQGVNDSGEIVGNCAVNNRANATAWVNGAVSKLPVPSGFSTSLAISINDAGQIVGYGQDFIQGKPEIESLAELGNPTSGTFTLSFPAAGGTETTQAIPYNATAVHVEGFLDGLAAISGSGGITCTGGPLPTAPITVTFKSSGPQSLFTPNYSGLGGGAKPSVTVTQTQLGVGASLVTEGHYWKTNTSAPVVLSGAGLIPMQISANGEVVGYVSVNNDGSPPYNYYKLDVNTGGASTLVGNTIYNAYIAINASGEIVLDSGTNGSSALLINPNGKSTTIFGTPANLSINTQGDVCAVGEVAGNDVALIWTPSKGATPLTNYLPKNSGWTEIGPNSMNDNGLIVGEGFYKGALTAFLLQLPKGAY